MLVKIKALLWTHKATKNGEHEIRLRLTLYKEVVYLSTGYTSSIDDWDKQNDCPKPTHPKFKSVIKKIGDLTEAIDFEIKLLLKKGIDIIPLSDIKNKIKTPIQKSVNAKILAFYQTIISELEEEARIGYSKIFKSSRDNIKKFLNGTDKNFINFTKKDFEDYEKYLLRTVHQESSISVYIRTFSRLWNIAIERGLCSKEHHPSKYIKFKAYRRFKTKKRALSADVIQSIESLRFEINSREYRSQQYFLFSYYARGINFIDLAKLKNENIQNNEIEYIRSKNKRHYHFQLHPKAYAIINFFLSIQPEGSEYIFPILTNRHDTPKRIDARIDSALKDLNEDLAKMARMIGLDKKLTSYAARHSFATTLRNKKVSVSIIQEALGHETELQTTTYLDEIDDTIVAKMIEEAL